MIFPLRDENPSRTFPVVTIALIAANTAVFLYQMTLGRAAGEAFVYSYAAIPGRLVGAVGAPVPGGPPAIATLVTSMFLHGGLTHLLGNMWFLWLFGDNVEDAMGKVRFLAFYLIGGIAAAIAHVATQPTSPVPMVGASGAISAVLGAYALLYPAARVRTLLWFFFIFVRVVRVPALLYLGVWFLFQVLSSAGGGGGIAWFAHVGGFLAGIVMLPLFTKRRRRA